MNFSSAKKVALFSDIHFGKTRDSLTKLKLSESYIDWFVKKCEENQIDVVIFAGDWFNNRTSIGLITSNIAYSCLKKIASKFPTLIILGNHDTAFKTSVDVNSIKAYGEMTNVYVIEKFTDIMIGNKRFALCPWSTEVNKVTGYDFAVGHVEFSGAIRHDGCAEEEIKVYEMKDLFNMAPLVFMGHYHIRKEYYGETSKILTIGSALELDWGDYGNEKGFYVLNLDSRSYELIKNNVSPIHFKYYWSKLLNKEQIITTEQIKGNFLKLVVDCPYKFESIIKVINEINIRDPLRNCEPEYVFNANIDLMERGHSFEKEATGLKMTKLQYMEKFIDKMPEESMNGLDRNKLKEYTKMYYVRAEEM